MARTVPWLLLGCVGGVVGYDLHVLEILSGAVSVESLVGGACKKEIADGAVDGAEEGLLLGPEGAAAEGAAGAVVGVSACAVEATAVAAVTLVASTLDVGLWLGFSLRDEFRSPDVTRVKRKVERAPDRVLHAMRWSLDAMKGSFKEMQEGMVKLTKSLNEENWSEVAAQSTVVLGRGKKFTVALQAALDQGGCKTPIVPVTCKSQYFVCAGSGCSSKGCLAEPDDCYQVCCTQQQDYCNGDEKCLHERGCGKNDVHPPSFQTQNCELLEQTLGDFEEAKTEVNGMHDCACALQGRDRVMIRGCGVKFEKDLRQLVTDSFNRVVVDLNNLSLLYKRAGEDDPSALVAMVSSGSSQVAQNLHLACRKVKSQIPECNLFPAPTPAPGPDSGSASTPHVVAFSVLSIVFVGMMAMLFEMLLDDGVISNLCKQGKGVGAADEEAVPAQSQTDEGGATNSRPLNADVGGPERPGAVVAAYRKAGKATEPKRVTFRVLSFLLICAQIVQMTDGPRTASPGMPTGAPLDASVAECLARSHAVQQTYDTCEDALAILDAAADRDEPKDVTLRKIVSKLAGDFPDLAKVASGRGP